MKRIQVTLDVHLDEEKCELLQRTHWQNLPAVLMYTMMDAFSEFCAHRYIPEEYVAKRYPDGPPIEDKVAEVRARNAVAAALKSAAGSAEYTEVEVAVEVEDDR